MNCDKKLHSLREETQLVIGAGRKDTLLESAKTKLKANTDKITPGSRKRVKNNNVLKAYQRRSIRARNIGTELEIRSMTKRGNTTLRSQIRKTVQAQTRVPAQIQVLQSFVCANRCEKGQKTLEFEPIPTEVQIYQVLCTR